MLDEIIMAGMVLETNIIHILQVGSLDTPAACWHCTSLTSPIMYVMYGLRCLQVITDQNKLDSASLKVSLSGGSKARTPGRSMLHR